MKEYFDCFRNRVPSLPIQLSVAGLLLLGLSACSGQKPSAPESEAESDARPQLRILASLSAKSHITSLEELAPYTRSLTVFQYDVEEVLDGTYDEDIVYVAHWTVLDSEPLAFQGTSTGERLELLLEPFNDVPQVASENLSDTVVDDFSLPLYYDAGGISLGLKSNLTNTLVMLYPEDATEKNGTSASHVEGGQSASDSRLESVQTTQAFSERERKARARNIQQDIETLERQAGALGGWHQWDDSLATNRNSVKEVLSGPFTKSPKAPTASSVHTFGARDDQFFFRFMLDYFTNDTLSYTEPPRRAPFSDKEPDSFEFVLDVHDQLARMGIDLIFVPVPVKTEVYLDTLVSEDTSSFPGLVSTKHLIYRLLKEGVEVLDILPSLLQQRVETDDPLYLYEDHHWAAKSIESTADLIAARLSRYDFVAEFADQIPLYTEKEVTLPIREGVYTARAVSSPDGTPNASVEDSPLLIMGDSFTYVFDVDAAKQPLCAGIGPHVSKRIGMPVSHISRGGRAGTSVLSDLARLGPERLAGIRTIVWIRHATALRPEVKWEHVQLPQSGE